MKRFDILTALVLLTCGTVFAQSPFQYKRAIGTVPQEGWYSIALPGELYKDVNRDMSDIRLYALHEDDTVEIPYIVNVRADEVTSKTIDLQLLNKSVRESMLYLTFEVKEGQKVNYIDLKFHDPNYFGLVTLEGSDNRQEWFEIVTDRRIVSVRSGGGDYSLSTISFPLSNYRFLRFRVKSDVPLDFQSASFQRQTVRGGIYSDIPLTWSVHQDKKLKRTLVDITLDRYVPISFLSLQTDTTALFYRPLRIEYVRDSARTDKGWIKYYQTVYDGHLTSYKPNEFSFDWAMTREVRLVILDSDNPPLTIQRISAKGPEIHLVSFLKPGRNFMLYGARDMGSPTYDLVHFEKEIADAPAFASLGAPEKISSDKTGPEALFNDRIWLWSLMALMILLLGFFTIKMMKQKTSGDVAA